jgi:hypothetical protein
MMYHSNLGDNQGGGIVSLVVCGTAIAEHDTVLIFDGLQ